MNLFDDELEQKPVDPLVVNSLAEKYPDMNLQRYNQQFSDEELKKAQDSAREKKANLGWAQFGAGVGDALAGKNGASDDYFNNLRKNIDSDTVGNFKERRDQAQKNMAQDRQLQGSDPASMKSQSFRKAIEANFPQIAKQYGDSWQNVTADDADLLFKPLQLREQMEARKETARILAGDRAEARAQRDSDKQARLDEKMQGLQTPYGMANTIDDAKQLKEAHESKKNFDAKIQEMIDLRKKYGGEMMNREAVARGQQLSKDLLLEYKNMAKLGVLSKSDEDIINAILPSDPLAFKVGEAMTGQDSILSNLQKFKGDSDRDFQTRVSTRTRQGLADMKNQPAGSPQKTIVKTQTNEKTGQKRVVYSDGTTEVVSNVAGGR